MKIVDAPRPNSKAAQFREIAMEIAGKDKAAFFESEGDFKAFCKVARKLKFNVKSRKLQRGGWNVWVKSDSIAPFQ